MTARRRTTTAGRVVGPLVRDPASGLWRVADPVRDRTVMSEDALSALEASSRVPHFADEGDHAATTVRAHALEMLRDSAVPYRRRP